MLIKSLKALLRANPSSKQSVLFHRDYLRFQGGHLKVWHYFQHLQATEAYSPQIYFTPPSIQDRNKLWQGIQPLSTWQPAQAKILFLAGLDWQAVLNNAGYLEKRKNLPVINLIQGLSHAQPADVKYAFLKERAIRICVSQQVAEAIQATAQVNGPVFTIPNGVDLNTLPTPLQDAEKDIDLLIVALKKPQLGWDLQHQLSTEFVNLQLVTELLPREQFLALLNRAKMSLFLPHYAEGFYLPALESMALGGLVVCPDCVGNRSFCRDGETCFSPTYSPQALLAAVRHAKSLTGLERVILVEQAKQQVAKHSLVQERRAFLDIMNNIKELW